jgi:hypothetical protein
MLPVLVAVGVPNRSGNYARIVFVHPGSPA